MLSVIIPSWKDPLLQKTIDSLLENAGGEIEIIAVLDGYWPEGERLGDKLGEREGEIEGERLGESEGEILGERDGEILAESEGDLLELSLGETEGETEAETEGEIDGDKEGEREEEVVMKNFVVFLITIAFISTVIVTTPLTQTAAAQDTKSLMVMALADSAESTSLVTPTVKWISAPVPFSLINGNDDTKITLIDMGEGATIKIRFLPNTGVQQVGVVGTPDGIGEVGDILPRLETPLSRRETVSFVVGEVFPKLMGMEGHLLISWKENQPVTVYWKEINPLGLRRR